MILWSALLKKWEPADGPGETSSTAASARRGVEQTATADAEEAARPETAQAGSAQDEDAAREPAKAEADMETQAARRPAAPPASGVLRVGGGGIRFFTVEEHADLRKREKEAGELLG